MTRHDRRAFLGHALGVGALAFTHADPWPLLARRAAGVSDDDAPRPDAPIPGGRLLDTLLFEDRRRRRGRVDRPYGQGLAGRLRHDLARLTSDTLVTSNERFYIRTRCPDTIDLTRPWKIHIHGRVATPVRLAADTLDGEAVPMGVHLLECSGTGTSGLISAAAWDGVPIADVLNRVEPDPTATRVLISGYDDHSRYDRNYDERGCDWIFTRRQLVDAGAFVATRMNGHPLPRDHGFPVRLVVPGWYGCCCVKWLDEIRFVDEDAPATRHMRHFARRTHQRGAPRRARDFRAATIDLAAMPVRVEQWRVNGALLYRVIGIMWGGDRTTDALTIRLGGRATPVRVDHCAHRTTRTWTLWSHLWRPARTGPHRISLHVDDASVRTRRLDDGYYARTVRIDEV